VGINLPVLWYLIIGFALMMYVVMDGFDLGIGILFPFVPARSDRDLMVNSVAPIWDGNETWLVFGGAALFAAFSLAYAIILSALYLPLVTMLLGLIGRGVSFEFRFKADDERKKLFWDQAFAWGSYIAALSQGVALGAFINGFKVANGAYAGGVFDWLTPFSVFTGIGVLTGYALLGSTWLVMKTEGALQQRMRTLARRIAVAVLLAIAIVSVWTPLTHPHIAARWFALPNLELFAPVPILVLLATWSLRRTLAHDTHAAPFLLALALVFLGYTGFIISIWPQIVPPQISIWQAASPPESMGFTLVGALFVIPFILMYTSWSYYVFRGKVRAGEGYH
jgi:cytochrome bd ubiquinol oxidase subunit II